jgi:formylmethanofuran dehydrogenase subunit A
MIGSKKWREVDSPINKSYYVEQRNNNSRLKSLLKPTQTRHKRYSKSISMANFMRYNSVDGVHNMSASGA